MSTSKSSTVVRELDDLDKSRVIPAPTGNLFGEPEDPAVDYDSPVNIQLTGPIFIGGKQIQNWDVNNEKQWRVKIDWERQVVWFRVDTGSSIGVAWTPFSNVKGVSLGMKVKRPIAPGPNVAAATKVSAEAC